MRPLIMTRASAKTLVGLLGLAGLIYVAVTFHYANFASALSDPKSTDFYKFHLSAADARTGLSPYWPAPYQTIRHAHCQPALESGVPIFAAPLDPTLRIGERQCLHPNLNPPFFVAITLPLAKLEFPTALSIWIGMLLGVGIGTFVLAIRAIAPKQISWRSSWPLLVLLCLVFLLAHPVFANFQLGQIGTVVALGLVWCWGQMRRGRAISAGLGLGVLMGLKPFLGLFFIGLLLIRQWRAALACTAAGLCTVAIGILIFGPAVSLDYLKALQEVRWHTNNWNASLMNPIFQIFGPTRGLPMFDLPSLGRLLGYGAAFSAIGLWAFFIVHFARRRSDLDKTDALFMTAPAVALLASPLGWMYYLPALLIPLLVILCWRPRVAPYRLQVLGLALVIGLIIIHTPLYGVLQVPTALADWLEIHRFLLATLLLLGLSIWHLVQRGQES